MDNNNAVPCEKCGKPLSTLSLSDGTKMTMLDGSEINICHRCVAIENGFSPEDFDAVWGKKDYAYKMGFDSSVNGANTTNCHFSIFTLDENTRSWEVGVKDGVAHNQATA